MLARHPTIPALSFILTLGLLAGGDALAMGKKPASGTAVIAPSVPAPVHEPVVIVGNADYQKGYELGHRNGTLIAHRLRATTLGLEGCSAMSKYQRALITVANTVKAPRNSGHSRALGKGFFRGYLDSLRASIQDARLGCSTASFEHGNFAGELLGTLLCQVAKTDLELYGEIESASLFDGWSGGALEVQDECLLEAQKVLSACGPSLEDLQSVTEHHLHVSCSD